MKRTFIVLTSISISISAISLVFIPSIAFASWWNPLSWNWTDLFNSPTQTIVQIPIATTSPIQIPTATTSISVVIATSTPTTTIVVSKKTVTKVPVKPSVVPIVISNPVVPVQAPQPQPATTTPVNVQATPFVITSPSTNNVWEENTNQNVIWTPYTGNESNLITYQIVIGNTATNISQQVFDNVLDSILNTQTSASFPATKLLEEFSSKSGIPENQINTDFYVQVNAVNIYASSGGDILASTPRIPITIPLTPTVTVIASTTLVSSKSSNAIVSWTSTNATSCSLNISPLPVSEALIGTTTTEGSLSTGTLTTPTTYTITCVNGTSTVATGNVTVAI